MSFVMLMETMLVEWASRPLRCYRISLGVKALLQASPHDVKPLYKWQVQLCLNPELQQLKIEMMDHWIHVLSLLL